jgi:hypothetical protein
MVFSALRAPVALLRLAGNRYGEAMAGFGSAPAVAGGYQMLDFDHYLTDKAARGLYEAAAIGCGAEKARPALTGYEHPQIPAG